MMAMNKTTNAMDTMTIRIGGASLLSENPDGSVSLQLIGVRPVSIDPHVMDELNRKFQDQGFTSKQAMSITDAMVGAAVVESITLILRDRING